MRQPPSAPSCEHGPSTTFMSTAAADPSKVVPVTCAHLSASWDFCVAGRSSQSLSGCPSPKSEDTVHETTPTATELPPSQETPAAAIATHAAIHAIVDHARPLIARTS